MTKLWHGKRLIIRNSILLFIALSIVYVGRSMIFQNNMNQVKKQEVLRTEEQLLNTESHVLTNRIDRLLADELIMADWMDMQVIDGAGLEELAPHLILMSDRRRYYDQLRIISPDGRELLRINYDEAGAYAVDSIALVNVSEKPYFSKALLLPVGHVFMSQLNLYLESGAIAQPIKPTIRFSTPVYGEGNQIAGIFVMNYSAQRLLDEFAEIAAASEGHLFFLNRTGGYIVNTLDPQTNWAFLYPSGESRTFAGQFPAEWETIRQGTSGRLETENGYFIYRSIIPETEEGKDSISIASGDFTMEEGNWIAVSYFSKADQWQKGIVTDFFGMIAYIVTSHPEFILAIFLISVGFGLLTAVNRMVRDKIKYFSEYDAMTGALNRRAGVSALEKTYRDMGREQRDFCVCFMDINGLKEVNDHLGHDEGDALIQAVAGGVKKVIRRGDYFIRLGGDEFLIVFPGANSEQAEGVWHRIVEEYERINREENRPYTVSVSHGIAQVTPEMKRVVDEVLNEADTKMYAEKRVLKEGLKVVRKA